MLPRAPEAPVVSPRAPQPAVSPRAPQPAVAPPATTRVGLGQATGGAIQRLPAAPAAASTTPATQRLSKTPLGGRAISGAVDAVARAESRIQEEPEEVAPRPPSRRTARARSTGELAAVPGPARKVSASPWEAEADARRATTTIEDAPTRVAMTKFPTAPAPSPAPQAPKAARVASRSAGTEEVEAQPVAPPARAAAPSERAARSAPTVLAAAAAPPPEEDADVAPVTRRDGKARRKSQVQVAAAPVESPAPAPARAPAPAKVAPAAAKAPVTGQSTKARATQPKQQAVADPARAKSSKRGEFSETAWFMRVDPSKVDPKTGRVDVDQEAYRRDDSTPEAKRRKFSLRRSRDIDESGESET